MVKGVIVLNLWLSTWMSPFTQVQASTNETNLFQISIHEMAPGDQMSFQAQLVNPHDQTIDVFLEAIEVENGNALATTMEFYFSVWSQPIRLQNFNSPRFMIRLEQGEVYTETIQLTLPQFSDNQTQGLQEKFTFVFRLYQQDHELPNTGVSWPLGWLWIIAGFILVWLSKQRRKQDEETSQ